MSCHYFQQISISSAEVDARKPAAVLGAILLIASFSAVGAALPQSPDLKAMDGVWVYVEDRTEGRALERLGPPMSSKFSFRIEEGAIVLASGHGSGHKDVKVALDGSATELPGEKEGTSVRYRAAWKDGVFSYETDYMRAPGTPHEGLIRKEFRVSKDGLLVRVILGSPATSDSLGLYRHPEDIAMPEPAKAKISDLDWLAGAWVGSRGTNGSTTFEERWSPPLGGAMLAISRTVSRERMSAFEYLRIVERNGGLVYVAQPGGGAPTEFVLSEVSAKRAVFDNPRHDYPKRIVYELAADGRLSATIGFMKGGTPRRFEFRRDDD